jgi:hypothetical protein
MFPQHFYMETGLLHSTWEKPLSSSVSSSMKQEIQYESLDINVSAKMKHIQIDRTAVTEGTNWFINRAVIRGSNAMKCVKQ